ncbi:MAG: DUF2336 domain-containing protein [Alphaproteobacteria bacterium]|nr:DUF2336 domain-containing protein [Alphaproteobacteria bacterium]
MEDVNRLAKDPSPVARAGTAAKLAQEFNSGRFNANELRLAEQIFRAMVKDAEVRVREALAVNIKNTPSLPHDVAVSLAKDVDSVSLPMISFSDVLTPDDLVAIIESQGNVAKMEAIAGRKIVAASVADALVERGTESVVVKLVSNAGAELREPTLHRVIDRFPESESIQSPMIHRQVLPVTIAERLVMEVAEHLRERLLSKHKISAEMAMDLVLQTRERATATLSMGVSDIGLDALVRQLGENRRLTGSLVLRALCMGNVRFFEHTLAALAGVPIANTRVLVHDTAGNGLKAVWSKAKLPAALCPAIRAALDVVAQTEFDGRELDAERYSRRIVERILTQYETFGVEFDGDDLDYLLGQVSKLPSAAVAVH